MSRFLKKHQLAIVTVTYWFLLLYMLAALLWWFIALNNQNNAMARFKLQEIKRDNPSFFYEAVKIENERQRKTAQYIGEGSIFLLMILMGAVVVYRIVRRQLKLSQQQQNFMMAVTHELKTPIAITQLNLETLQRRKLDDATKEKLITNTLHEANRLNNLCNNILFSAQLDEGNYTYSFQEINMSELVGMAVSEFKTRFQQKPFNTLIDENVFMHGESLLLQMLINNLIENAVKYSDKQSPVTVALKQQNNKIVLQVADNGVGIKEEEKKKVFDKFYRSGNENIRNTKGTGLGLYLCNRIVKRHKGNMGLADNQPQGSIFTATFNA